MTANNVDVGTVEVECLELEDIDPDIQITSCRLECQCNTPSRAVIGVTLSSANPVSTAVVTAKGPLVLGQLLDKATRFQEMLYKAEGTSVTLTVTNISWGQSPGGKGGRPFPQIVKITGTLSAPTFRVSAGTLAATYSILNSDALMEAFNPSIYGGTYHTHGGSEGDAPDLNMWLTNKITNGGTNEVRDHLQMLIDLTANDSEEIYSNQLITTIGSSTKEVENKKLLLQQGHETNTSDSILPLITGILERSNLGPRSSGTGLFKTWNGDPVGYSLDMFEIEGASPNPRMSRSAYANWLVREYTNSKNFYNFLLSGICPSFLFDYICPFAPNQSYIQHTKVNAQLAEEIDVHIEPIKNLTLNLASSYQRPIAQIVVHGIAAEHHGSRAGGMQPVGAHPNPINPEGGKIVNQASPSWWSPEVPNEQTLEAAPKTTSGILKNGRQINTNSKQKVRQVKLVHTARTGTGDRENFLEVWATKQYGIMSLQHTSASISVPLDLRYAATGTGSGYLSQLCVGERMSLSSPDITAGGDRAELLRGFLQSVVHDISLDGGGNVGIAETHLEFTYIKMPGFNLPGDVTGPST